MFDDYYSKYLGIDKVKLINGCLVCKTALRDMPLNKKFIYRIIITDYYGDRIVSVSPSISDRIIHNICIDIEGAPLDDVLNSQNLCNTGLRLSKFHRMTIDSPKVTINKLDNYFTYEYIEDYQKFIVRDGGKIISYCKSSNIDFGYRNIVVWTDEDYRRKGLARELLIREILKCKDEGIKPIYITDCKNSASIELAKSVGFEIIQNEIMACEVTD